MGTSMMNYVLLGIKLPYPNSNFNEELYEDGDEVFEACENYMDNPYESRISSKDGISVIFDGMNGQYVFAGRIFEKGNESTGGIEPTICDADYDYKEIVAGALNLMFGPEGSVARLTDKDITVDDIHVWVFSHWH